MDDLNNVAEDDDKPIETDQDTIDEDILSEGLTPYNLTEVDIDIKEDPTSIFQYMRRYDQGRLIIDPEFQRNLVWKPEQKSKFIESVLLNFPLPPFYLNQRRDGKYIIIDGIQRTETLHGYIHNQFKLEGLKALLEFNGKSYAELDMRFQAKIEDKRILLCFFKPSVPMNVVYDVFNRINMGGTQLNRQEIRTCLYSGKSTQLLKELSQAEYFKKAIDEGIKSTRMKDWEAVLRFIAFSLYNYERDYKGDMSKFLEDAMKEINSMEDQKMDEIKSNFKRVMEWTFDYFGDKNFRFPTKNGRGRINIAMLETVCLFFLRHDDSFLLLNKEKIKKNFHDLIMDASFMDAATFATGDKSRVLKRFSLVQEILSHDCVEVS